MLTVTLGKNMSFECCVSILVVSLVSVASLRTCVRERTKTLKKRANISGPDVEVQLCRELLSHGLSFGHM